MDNKTAFDAEVKRQKKNFKPQLLEAKTEVLKTKVLNKYDVEWRYRKKQAERDYSQNIIPQYRKYRYFSRTFVRADPIFF